MTHGQFDRISVVCCGCDGSLSLPLDERLVLSSDGEHALRVWREGSAHNMLAMTRVAVWRMSVVNGRVVVNIDETPVIARYEERPVGARLNLVNMRTIFT